MIKVLSLVIVYLFCINSFGLCQIQPPQWWNQRVQQGKLLSSNEEPSSYLMASVGNGYTSFTVGGPSIYIGGVYNGPQVSISNPSHRASIPNFQLINITGDSNLDYAGLDIENATYTRVYSFSSSPLTIAQQVFYAHQSYKNLLVQEITVDNSQNSQDFQIQFETLTESQVTSIDFQITNITSSSSPSNTNQFNLTILEPELEGGFLTSVCVTTSVIPSQLDISAGRISTFIFLTVLVTNLEGENYVNQSTYFYEKSFEDQDQLLAKHLSSWSDVWESGIEVGGNLELAQVINSSLYYILSSIRYDWHWSLSPGGLASNGYHGHMFWDAETWMYPPMLVLFPYLARDSILQYRLDNLLGAQEKALSYDEGYDGYMFPWESAFSGYEVCPTIAPTGVYEQHITGDISFAMRQYYYSTQDIEWLRDGGYDAIRGIATFWASRVAIENPNAEPPVYVIDLIIPPDEYAVGVNNSVYTNIIAKMALEWGIEAAGIIGDDTIPLELWQSIIDNIMILFNETTQMHPEYQGYDGEIIKQADVVLLGYPLMYNMSEEVRRNDLAYYENKTDVNGPAMTYSMHTIGWLELGNQSNAEKQWYLSWANSQKPFGVWTETPQGGTVNFITGAGGFLQGVIFGYGGLRIRDTCYDFYPQLPPDTDSLKIKNLNYIQSKFDIYWNTTTIVINLVSTDSYSQFNLISTYFNSQPIGMEKYTPIVLPSGNKFTIEYQPTFEKKKNVVNIQ